MLQFFSSVLQLRLPMIKDDETIVPFNASAIALPGYVMEYGEQFKDL